MALKNQELVTIDPASRAEDAYHVSVRNDTGRATAIFEVKGESAARKLRAALREIPECLWRVSDFDREPKQGPHFVYGLFELSHGGENELKRVTNSEQTAVAWAETTSAKFRRTYAKFIVFGERLGDPADTTTALPEERVDLLYPHPADQTLDALAGWFRRIADMWEGPDGSPTEGTEAANKVAIAINRLRTEPLALGNKHLPRFKGFENLGPLAPKPAPSFVADKPTFRVHVMVADGPTDSYVCSTFDEALVKARGGFSWEKLRKFSVVHVEGPLTVVVAETHAGGSMTTTVRREES